MSGVTMLSTAPRVVMWQLSAGTILFATGSILSLPRLASELHGNRLSLHLSQAMIAAAQTSVFTGGRKAEISMSTSWVRRLSQMPTFQAFAFETFGGLHADALALLKRLQGLLNQAIIAQEDVEGYFVHRRVSFIIAAAVGRQLAARRV